MNIKKHIPNALTLLNLLSGVLAIISLFLGNLTYIPFFIVIGLIADFLDGLVARALGVSSPIGKELDSLADMVSFGVVPGLLMVYLVSLSVYEGVGEFNFVQALANTTGIKNIFIVYFPLIITLFSALRLAIFNVSTNQSTEFIGLATPASTIFVLGLFLVSITKSIGFEILNNLFILIVISIALSYLLISNIRMFSFKLSSFRYEENKLQVIFLIIGIILAITLRVTSVFLIILVYVILNLLRKLIVK